MIQKERTLRLLQRFERGVCAETFIYGLSPGIPRVAGRVYVLREEGWDIKTERCDLHTHRKGKTNAPRRVVKYRLDTWILNRGAVELAPEDKAVFDATT